MLTSLRNVKFCIKMCWNTMYITPVCVIFLIKLGILLWILKWRVLPSFLNPDPIPGRIVLLPSSWQFLKYKIAPNSICFPIWVSFIFLEPREVRRTKLGIHFIVFSVLWNNTPMRTEDVNTLIYNPTVNWDWIRLVMAHWPIYVWVAKEVKFHISLIASARAREI